MDAKLTVGGNELNLQFCLQKNTDAQNFCI